MTKQYDTTVRNAILTGYISGVGTAPTLKFISGGAPASCSAAETGTVGLSMTLPSTWQATPSGGQTLLTGTWSGTGAAAVTVGYYRFYQGASCREQGTITQAFALTTNAATSANSNVLHFASAAGVSAGQSVYFSGAPDNLTVLGVSGGDVTVSAGIEAGVSSGAQLYFGSLDGDLWMSNALISVGVTYNVTTRTLTAPGA